jgi:ABC-2 type transport system ATP-binding protein
MSDFVLQVAGLVAGYSATPVLSGVDLSIGSGEWFVLVGPNGSGKSTLLNCVSGLLTPLSGTVSLCGESVVEAPERAKRPLGYAHPPERLPALLTGRQCLEIYAAAKGLDGVSQESCEFAERLRLAPWLDRCVRTYSLGSRQKLSLLLALQGDPKLVVLDEAFNGLDPYSARLLKQELTCRTQRGTSILLATHSLDIVLQHASGVGLLLDGRLARIWTGDELDAIRAGSISTLETELVDAANASTPAG